LILNLRIAKTLGFAIRLVFARADQVIDDVVQ
jgi:hypothetical protein